MKRSPFIELVATLTLLAKLKGNPRKKTKGNNLTRAQSNGSLLDAIQNASGSASNVLLWTGNQSILLDGQFKRLKLGSTYGTGWRSFELP